MNKEIGRILRTLTTVLSLVYVFIGIGSETLTKEVNYIFIIGLITLAFWASLLIYADRELKEKEKRETSS